MQKSPNKIFLPTLFAVFCFAVFANAQSKRQTPQPTPTATPIAQQDDTEKVFTEEIKLNVNAFDPNGKFVSDVKKEDLVINEDGRIHQATSIRRVPANVLILLDTGGEMRAAKSLVQTKKTAKNLIESLHAEDSVAVMQYSDRAEIIAEWTDRENAVKSLARAAFGKRSMLFGALSAAAGFLQKTPLDNQHLVLITDGTDSINNVSERDAAMKNLLSTDINVHIISYTHMELIDIAPRAKMLSKTALPNALPDEVIATLPPGIRDMNRSRNTGIHINTDREFMKKMKERKKSLEDAEKYLAALSKDTNGELILPADAEEMLDKTALVASFIDASYVVTYAPKRALKESRAGEIRDIVVTSRRPDLLIEAHRKLIVASDEK